MHGAFIRAACFIFIVALAKTWRRHENSFSTQSRSTQSLGRHILDLERRTIMRLFTGLPSQTRKTAIKPSDRRIEPLHSMLGTPARIARWEEFATFDASIRRPYLNSKRHSNSIPA